VIGRIVVFITPTAGGPLGADCACAVAFKLIAIAAVVSSLTDNLTRCISPLSHPDKD
jgi:hypothetical protein